MGHSILFLHLFTGGWGDNSAWDSIKVCFRVPSDLKDTTIIRFCFLGSSSWRIAICQFPWSRTQFESSSSRITPFSCRKFAQLSDGAPLLNCMLAHSTLNKPSLSPCTQVRQTCLKRFFLDSSGSFVLVKFFSRSVGEKPYLTWPLSIASTVTTRVDRRMNFRLHSPLISISLINFWWPYGLTRSTNLYGNEMQYRDCGKIK